MVTKKYDRNISLQCPTCGCTEFEFEESVETDTNPVKCARCGRELKKDELIRENSENISEHVKEIGDEVVKDFGKKLKENLRKAFRGNKNVRFK